MTSLAHITHLEFPFGIVLFLLGVATGAALTWAYRRRTDRDN